ncbi:MAG: hypothetical protein A3C35_06850 [Omnitrophica bacterium RIFCSPHIGHO2_02_FULL_46_11]|nr:MAG: hypothetical protein A3C35_06850 [Omnitrophica bacterium RIFCSPHIGHO2_02_FULL_46_11]OGW86749.1 MAG: hypothetical protein A3A81_08755 [Omnitrophica bacterium RIFCSPLOWO2_01_FULL_45_10b]
MQVKAANTEAPWFLGSSWRLFGTLFLTVTLPMMVLIFALVVQIRVALQDQAIRQNAVAAQLAAKAVQEYVENLASSVENLALRSLLVGAIERKDSVRVRARLKELLSLSSDFNRAIVTDIKGIELYDYPFVAGAVGQDLSSSDWYQGVSKTNRTYISEIHQRFAKPQIYIVSIATPIRNDQKEIIGYLVGQNPIEILSKALAQLRPSFAGSFVLVDQHGFVATKPRSPSEFSVELRSYPLSKKMFSSQKGFIKEKDPITGEESFISYHQIPRSGWVIVASQPISNVFGLLNTVNRIILLFSLLSFAVILGFGYLWFETIRRYHKQRKVAEEALKASEKHARSIIETAYDAFISIDANGIITNWNHQAETTFGWRREEIIGHLLAETIIPLQYREAHKRGLHHFLATGKGPVLNRRIEISALHKDGHEFHIELTIWPVQTGEIYSFNAFVHDITEREQAEAALRQAATELVRSKAELEQLELFAFAATHDIQEPLHKILTFSDLLKTESVTALDPKGRRYLDLVQNTAKRMSQMMEELRELSKIAQEGSPFEEVDLESVVREVLHDLELRVQETKGQVEVRKLPTIRADRMQMRALFQNLIANALKFHRKDEPPHIMIDSRNVKEGVAEITIQDNGIGFDEKYLDRIFKPFQRLHGSGEYEGSGMGLAICQKIMLRHKGKITAKSVLGQGSTFIITLPEHQV